MNTTSEPFTDERRDRGQLTFGLILVAVGGAFMAERLGYVTIDHPVRFWPVILVVIAVGKVLGRIEGGLRAAFTLVWVAAIFLLHNFYVLRLQDSWPLFIVLAGVMTLWKGLARSSSKEIRS